jgi:dTMP kinase
MPLFISFEGVEGSGKSTQSRMLADALRAEGRDVLHTSEPGGTELGKRIRAVLLEPSEDGKAMDSLTELLLYAADRRQHLAELVLPALDAGGIVITDRFSDSTLAYQGHARGIAPEMIAEVDRLATGGLKPELTFLMDIDVRAGLERNRESGKSDRFELEDVAFHERVRAGFLAIAKSEPERVMIIDATRPKHEVHDAIMSAVRRRRQ